MLDTSLINGPSTIKYEKGERTKEQMAAVTAREVGEYKERNSIPGLQPKKSGISDDRPKSKAQIAEIIIAQAKNDFHNDLQEMSEQDRLNFLNFIEDNRESLQNSSGDKDMLGSALTAFRTFKAVRASLFIFNTAIYFIVPQFTFGIFSLIGFTGEMVPFFKHFIPGQTVFILCWVIVSFIGLVTMIYALLIYLGNIVNCLGGMKGIVFLLCVCAYFIPLPLLNAFPWFILWLWAVSSSQGKSDSVTEQ